MILYGFFEIRTALLASFQKGVLALRTRTPESFQKALLVLFEETKGSETHTSFSHLIDVLHVERDTYQSFH
jgi:hypothetical protein